MDVRYDAIEDIERARRPSLQLIGTPEGVTVDLNSLRKAGVESWVALLVFMMARPVLGIAPTTAHWPI
jgi:hypothetical protein